MNKTVCRPARSRRILWLSGLLVVVGLAASLFRRPIQHAVMLQSVLSAGIPSETAFQELADGAADPIGFLQRAWDTGRVPHRALAMSYLKDKAGTRPDLYQGGQGLLLAGAVDPDVSVRELALGTLARQGHAATARLATAWLSDVDPQVRLLGIRYLRRLNAAAALSAVFARLDDPDLQVLTTAESALRNWTHQDFGIRISQSGIDNAPGATGSVDPAKLRVIRDGVEQWKAWWKVHQGEFPPADTAPTAEPQPTRPVRAGDFALRDLKDRTVRLTDFRGKVVLVNFWTTWCPGCQVEVPDLIALQKDRPDQLVVLGVSLDGLTEVDEHGHGDDARTHPPGASGEGPSLARTRQLVSDFIKANGISYIVLMDPRSEVGGRFNAGELPTNLLIDRDGFIRRRFVGGRAADVLRAMVDELTPATGR